MIRLDTYQRKLQAVLSGAITTSQPTAIVCYTDIENENQKKFFVESVTSTLNGATAVDILPAPDKAMVREVDSIHIRNNDTVAATVTVRINDNGTNYELVEVTIQSGETLIFTDSEGWKVFTKNGNTASVFNYIDFNLNETPSGAEGRLYWDSGDGSLTLGLKGGNTGLQLGQENVALAYNDSGVTITAGSVVAVSGAQGQRPKIVLADADTEPLSAATLGIAAESISNGAEGFVCTFGLVRGIDTSTFVAGDPIYLSQTAGKFTATRPSAPAHTVFLGWVIKVNASSGELFVNISNGWELDELHNVLISSPLDGQTLKYDAGVWKNGTLGTNGGGTGLTSFTANGVVYASSTSALTTNSNFTFNGTTVEIGGNLNFSSTGRRITGDFSNATIASRAMFQTSTANSSTTVGAIPSGTGTVGTFVTYNNSTPTNSARTSISTSSTESRVIAGVEGSGTALPLTFAVNASERMRVTTDGELLIGTTTDNGAYLLQVNSQIYATNATIATSDARLKENVTPITNALKTIGKVQAVSFDFKRGTKYNFDTVRQAGFIAQDLQSALSEEDYKDSIVKECGSYFGVAYEKMVPVLVAAIQEQQQQIDALKAEVAALKDN